MDDSVADGERDDLDGSDDSDVVSDVSPPGVEDEATLLVLVVVVVGCDVPEGSEVLEDSEIPVEGELLVHPEERPVV